MWALTTRVKPSKDVAIIPNCAGMPLDQLYYFSASREYGKEC